MKIPHAVSLDVAPAPAIAFGDGFGFGVSVIPPQGQKVKGGFDFAICVAGKPDIKGAGVEDFIVTTLAHELAHYEQFRDGKPLQERGVVVRGRTLQARMMAAAP